MKRNVIILMGAVFAVSLLTFSATAENRKMTLDIGNGVKMELVQIPAGKFKMGSPDTEAQRDSDEGPVHEVTFAKPFYMGAYEVTLDQWQAIMGFSAYQNGGQGSNLPANSISWDDTQVFCKALSARIGKTVRLPTEAEWEYAARAGSGTRFFYGDDPGYKNLPEFAWVGVNSGHTSAVAFGQKKPNPWGLYDIYGNLWEWTQDYYHPSYAGAPSDGSAVETPVIRIAHVLRGCCDYSVGRECRSANRDWGNPTNRCGDVGFRVVVEAP